jgi:DNA polymerase-1
MQEPHSYESQSTKKAEKPRVYLVDGSGYIFRAFYAVQSLSTRDGFPTNALFGFVRMLVKLLNQSRSEHVVMVFDSARKNFRHDLYPEYKANRKECPPELVPQMPLFRDLSRAFGLPVLELNGFEADDIIGTLSTRLAHSEIEAVIVSGDKDLMQLVGGSVSIYDAMKDQRIGAIQVKEKFGVEPDMVVDILALIGDSSDNVPGVSGIGPKTAAQLIQRYGGVEQILSKLDLIEQDKDIRGRAKIASTLKEQTELLRLCRRLVSIELDTPVKLCLDGQERSLAELNDSELLTILSRQTVDQEQLAALLERFEFHTLLKEFNLNAPKKAEESNFQQITVLAEDFESFIKELSSVEHFAFDSETNSLDPLSADIIGMSFCWNEQRSYYLPVAHRNLESNVKQIDLEYALLKLKPILQSSLIKKSGQNLKYDCSVLIRYGISLAGVSFDCMLASYLLNPEKRSHNLTVLARDYLGRSTIEFDEVTLDKGDFSEVSIADATRYACQDAEFAWALEQILAPKLKEKGLEQVMYEIETPLVSVLARLECRGIKLNVAQLAQYSEELDVRLAKLDGEVKALAGMEFNLNSPKQMAEVLFDKLALPTKGLKRTKTGFSTDSGVLEHLALIHPLPKLVLDYRMLHKLKSTYVDALPAQVSKVTERLHTKLNQTIAATGRLSSSDPNLQNIPIRTAEGNRIRAAFIAEPGSSLIVADYSQIELRLLAHLSEDTVLVESFKSGRDIHSETAREILGLPKEQSVSTEERRLGKTINFGIIYGMGPYRLGRELGIPFDVARRYIESYFQRFLGVKQYFERVEREAESLGYVSTLFGRKRFASEIDSSGRDKEFVLRALLNAPLQGSAADIIKLAMIKIDQRIESEQLDLKMVLQVHDELVFEAPDNKLDQYSLLVQDLMQQVVALKVPLLVDVGSGRNWQEAN